MATVSGALISLRDKLEQPDPATPSHQEAHQERRELSEEAYVSMMAPASMLPTNHLCQTTAWSYR